MTYKELAQLYRKLGMPAWDFARLVGVSPTSLYRASSSPVFAGSARVARALKYVAEHAGEDQAAWKATGHQMSAHIARRGYLYALHRLLDQYFEEGGTDVGDDVDE